jgi:hypothetical protein
MRRFALRLLTALVPIACAAMAQAQTGFGSVETPACGSTVFGVVEVSGFFLDFNAVDSVKLYIDGQYVSTADINLPRADVLLVFPTYVNSPTSQPGFLTSFLGRNFSSGAHTVEVRATESTNPSVPIVVGSCSVTIDNSLNQAPFGFIDIPTADPAVTEEANSAFPVSGWALDDTQVDHIDIMVDNQIVAGAVCCNIPPTYPASSASSAVYGTTRPDVQAAFPDLPNAIFSGWQANIDSTSFIDGVHEIEVRVTDNEGASRIIGRRRITIDNASLNLHPFGTIDSPLDELTFTPLCTRGGFPSPCTPDICNPTVINRVSGWVLDTGARLDFGQTGYVELLIDGVVIANTRRDCVYTTTGVFENCYGINRPDVEQSYPGFVNSDNAGYVFDFFALDDGIGTISIQRPVYGGGAVEVTRVAPGKHTVAVRAGDDAETFSYIGVPLSANIVTCVTHPSDIPAFGYIDLPYNYQFVSGVIDVAGWAFDPNQVSEVQIDIDGQVVGDAVYGLYRPDVPVADARVSSSYTGFSFFLDTTTLADSAHDINVYVIDHNGRRGLIGRRKMVVNNNVPTHGQ